MDQNLLSTKEAADFLGLKSQTLATWRMRKEKIPFIRVGRKIAYRQEDIEHFLAQNMVTVSSEVTP